MEGEQAIYFLKKWIEELTTSGKDKLDEETFKKVKKMCKQSDFYVIELFKIISKQLGKNHAEIRFSAFQISDEIFRRSHCFRELLLRDFKKFTSLVLGLNPKNPMPKPFPVAQRLKQKGVETIQKWYDVYGEGYVTLKLGYKYLRDCKKVDFAELTARTEAQRQRDEEERQRLEGIKKKRIDRINDELQAQSPEIKSTVMQLQNSFRLLIPDVHNFFIPVDDDIDIFNEGDPKVEEEEEMNNDGEYGSDYMRGHGIMKGMNVTINLEDMKRVQETPDNEIVVQSMREHYTILKTKLLPPVKKWEEIMRPYSEGNGIIIKHILDLKNLVEKNMKIFESINIEPQDKESQLSQANRMGDFDSDDDDDFIEVPFDDPRVQRAAASEAALLGIAGPSWGEIKKQVDEDPLNDPWGEIKKQVYEDPLNHPSTSQASVSQQSVQKFTKTNKGSKGKSSMAKFPEDFLDKMEHKPLRHHNPLAGLSQIWTAAPDLHEQDEVEETGGILGIATQRVHYERSWEPVRWTCRAPLGSGSLCPRKDREKCPLHGPIIPRDELGQPKTAEDAARQKAAQEQYERDHPAWQDPRLLAEIKAATGVDLEMPKGKAKRKRKYENLTDIRKTSPYDRLAKKVLSRKAVRRVNQVYRREHSSNAWGSTSFNPS